MNIQGLSQMQGMFGMMGGMSQMGGMGGTNNVLSMLGKPSNKDLTDDQKSTVNSILSNYSSSNLTSSDALDIFKKLKSAGISGGKSLKDTIEAAGFNADDLLQKANQAYQSSSTTSTTSTSGSSTSLTDDQKSTIDSILSQYDSTSLNTSDVQSIFKQFKDAGITPSDNLKSYVDGKGYQLDKFGAAGLPGMPQENQDMFWASQNQDSSSSINTSLLTTLKSILNSYDLSNLTSENQTNLLSDLNNANILI